MLNAFAKALGAAALTLAVASVGASAAPLAPARGEVAVESGAVVVAPYAYVDTRRRVYYDDYYYSGGTYVRAPFVRVWVPH